MTLAKLVKPGETWPWPPSLATQFGHPGFGGGIGLWWVNDDGLDFGIRGSGRHISWATDTTWLTTTGWHRHERDMYTGLLRIPVLKIFQGLNFINDTQRGSQRGCLCDYLEKAGMFLEDDQLGAHLSLGFLWTTSQTRNAKESSGVRLPEETWGNTGCKYCLLSFVFFAANVPSILGRSPFLWPTWRKRWT